MKRLIGIIILLLFIGQLTFAERIEVTGGGGGGGGGAPTDADYLVGTANASLSAEIVAGTSPGGQLGGTWASPTIDDLFLLNTGDTGTGDYTLDSPTFHLDSAQNRIGIGTVAPAYTLDVIGTVGIGTVTSGANFVVSSAGNVGIGTTAPARRLDVLGTAGVGIGTSAAGDALVVSSAGNTGIGTSAPLAKLDINGNTMMVGSNTINFADVTDGYQLTFDTATNTWAGEAAGGGGGGATYREITLLPESCVLDDNNPPAITIIESTGTGTPRFRVADFDATTDEIIYFTFVMPSDYTASSDPIIDIYWYTNDTTANETCVWGIQVSATTEADVDAMSECAMDADILYVSEDVNTTEANRLILTSGTLTYATYMDSASASDLVTIAIRRDADSTGATDDLTSDARLVAIHLKIPRS